MRKLMEMRSKIPLTVSIANPNQDMIGIPLAKSKRKEIGREEFGEKSCFHLESPPRAPRRGEIGFLDGGAAGKEFYCGGGGVVDYYGRLFGQGEWMIGGGGGGQAEPWGSGHVRRMEERWESHPQYTREIWRDHDNRYTGGGRSCWRVGDPWVKKLNMLIIEEKSESSISDTQVSSEDKQIDKGKDVNEEGKEKKFRKAKLMVLIRKFTATNYLEQQRFVKVGQKIKTMQSSLPEGRLFRQLI
ncbi:hypothetical protein IEQ34_007719 [Dendrobium chrysotoxum]|uniref:Uncharacterized protein n=1 Tax=Dendrobium chrysotoxum TaxID=161865 RepID=A0AAV7H2K5_DENCH|nr:hypothetical protein IEQ34_007719 [Dendrobium chrysotoxum]